MKTKEIFRRVIDNTDAPIFLLGYVYQNEEKVIQLGHNIHIVRQDGEDINISKMKEIENMEGFLFWTDSDEGIQFKKDNQEAIDKVLAEIVLNQK